MPVIEIFSSDEDNDNQSKFSSSTVVKNEENNLLPASENQNGDQNPSSVNSTVKYIFKEWDIKENDCEKDDVVLNGKSDDDDTNDQKKNNSSNELFEIKIKNFRLGKNVLNEHECKLSLDADGLLLTYSSK